jgi:peptidoglycan/xylan/chitin deacetylase (PgdA/CDA1 family)
MKVIVSHDVDLITAWENSKNILIVKLIARSSIELALGKIGLAQYILRFKELLKNKLHNIEELMEFDKQNNVPSTFFIGVNHGLGLNYSLKNAEYWIKQIITRGFDVGVHGIEFDNLEGIKKEYDIFQKLSGLKKFGIRMHYLRNCENTLRFLNEAGYLFDSTIFGLNNVSKVGRLWEFPLHLMDSSLFNQNGKWQKLTLRQAKDITLNRIQEAEKTVRYFTILLHDRYFSNSFKDWKEWYIWIIEYLRENNFEFVSYRKAVDELQTDSQFNHSNH